MTVPIGVVSNVEVMVLDFGDKQAMEEKLAEYLLKGFTIEVVTPYLWSTTERPASFNYWETEAKGFTVILAKRDFEVKTLSADIVKNAVTEGMKKRSSK